MEHAAIRAHGPGLTGVLVARLPPGDEVPEALGLLIACGQNPVLDHVAASGENHGQEEKRQEKAVDADAGGFDGDVLPGASQHPDSDKGGYQAGHGQNGIGHPGEKKHQVLQDQAKSNVVVDHIAYQGTELNQDVDQVNGEHDEQKDSEERSHYIAIDDLRKGRRLGQSLGFGNRARRPPLSACQGGETFSCSPAQANQKRSRRGASQTYQGQEEDQEREHPVGEPDRQHGIHLTVFGGSPEDGIPDPVDEDDGQAEGKAGRLATAPIHDSQGEAQQSEDQGRNRQGEALMEFRLRMAETHTADNLIGLGTGCPNLEKELGNRHLPQIAAQAPAESANIARRLTALLVGGKGHDRISLGGRRVQSTGVG